MSTLIYEGGNSSRSPRAGAGCAGHTSWKHSLEQRGKWILSNHHEEVGRLWAVSENTRVSTQVQEKKKKDNEV